MSLIDDLAEQIQAQPDAASRSSVWSAWLRAHRDDLAELDPNDPGMMLLKSAGPPHEGWSRKATDLVREIRRARQSASGLTLVERKPGGLADVIGDLEGPDLPPDARSPSGYTVGGGGIYSLDEDGSELRVAPEPIVITGLIRDVSTGAHHLRLAWRSWGYWIVRVVARSTALDARSLIPLGSDGFPVDSTTASVVVPYLSAYEAANRDSLPVINASSAMGWQPNNAAFLAGHRAIGGEAEFLGIDGADQLAEAFGVGGSVKGWIRDVWEPARPYPRAILGIYAALAPVVLGVVAEATGFVVDWSGRSSKGKTTTLKVAASVWGTPDLVLSWKSTAVGIERAAALLSYLPTIADDTKHAARPEDVASVIYLATGTAGKLRGSVDGLRRTARIRTVMLSTGEQAASSFTQDVGARARVLALRGSPFLGDDETTKHAVDGLTLASAEHYGHAGPAVVQWLCDQRSTPGAWQQIVEAWRAQRDEYARAAPASGLGARAAAYLATLHTAAQLLSLALDLPVHGDALRDAAKAAELGVGDADRAAAALLTVIDWLTSHGDRVWRGPPESGQDDARPTGPVIGVWRANEPPAILTSVCREALERSGLRYEEAVQEWQDRGWLVRDGPAPTSKVRFGGNRARMLLFTAAAILAATG